MKPPNNLISRLIEFAIILCIVGLAASLLGLFGCSSPAPTTRSTAVLPPVDKGAALPYAETITAVEPAQPREAEVLATTNLLPSTVVTSPIPTNFVLKYANYQDWSKNKDTNLVWPRYIMGRDETWPHYMWRMERGAKPRR